MRVDLAALKLELAQIPDFCKDALCAEPAYADLSWFPERGESTREAKAVCARCLVQVECLAYAMSGTATRAHGIWGGTAPGERRETPHAKKKRQPRYLCELCTAVLPAGREGYCTDCEEWLARYDNNPRPGPRVVAA